jgi:cell wall-associated NlpC family hydrolase
MNHSGRKIAQIIFSTILAVLMLAQFGCAGGTVRALDYSLENELVEGEPTASIPVMDATPNPSESASSAPDETPAPEITPTPTLPDATPTPQSTDNSGETPLPSQTPELHRLTVLVQDAAALPLIGARVTLYQDGTVLFSGMTGSDGNVSWMLPIGHSFSVKAALSGYQVSDGDGKTYDMSRDERVKITLVAAGDPDGSTTPTPLPVPDGAPGKVIITAEDVTITPNQAGFALLDGVRAQTEFGQPVAVWVVDNGGFAAENPGAYRVTYGAFEEGKLITAQRTITVSGAEEDAIPQEEAQAPSGSSKERYEVLLAYRARVGEQLNARVEQLNETYRSKVQEAISKNEEARILAPAAVENDTDGMTSSAQDMQQTQDIKVTNWPDVLATFLAQNVENENSPLNVYALSDIPLDKLDSVFWDMNPIEVFRMDGTANVLLNAKSYEDMAQIYGMSARRKSFLYELMQPEFLRTFASITGSTAFAEPTKESVDALLSTVPADTNIERKQVVETALSLVGKISYVFGGKYNRLGWNDAWGNANEAGDGENIRISQDTGLDCSGFVSWVFINAANDPKVLRAIGNGSSNQWAHSTAIGWDEGRPGDLAFYCAPGERQYNHVGIIVSRDEDGSYLIAHCSSLQDGVVVTDAWSSGFRYLRRSAFFQ